MRWLGPILLAAACTCAEQVVLEEDTPAWHTLQGNVLLSERKYESAIEQYRRALALDASYFYAQFNIALADQSLGRLDEAKRWYAEALRTRPDNHEVVCNLGYLAFRAGDFAEAARRFQDAANLAAASPADAADYWFNLGAARERLEQWAEARRAYEGCLQIVPGHGPAHYNLGTLLLGPLAEEPEAVAHAQAHLEAALKADPQRAEAWVNLGLCHERAAHPQDAEAAMAKAVAVATGPGKTDARWQQVRWLLRQVPPRRLEARDGLLAILAERADYPEANGLLGQYWFQVGDYDQAIRYLEAEISGDRFDAGSPVDRECHYLLALIYTDYRPDARKATEHASAYYELHPDSPKIHALRRRAFRLTEASGVAVPAKPAPAKAEAAEKAEKAEKPAAPEAGKPEAGRPQAKAEAPEAEAPPAHPAPAAGPATHTAPEAEAPAPAPPSGHH